MDIQAVKQKHEKRLLQLPNVAGVGIGEKSGRRVIKVFVVRKVPESTLRPDEIVPKLLDGWETDLEEIGTVSVENS